MKAIWPASSAWCMKKSSAIRFGRLAKIVLMVSIIVMIIYRLSLLHAHALGNNAIANGSQAASSVMCYRNQLLDTRAQNRLVLRDDAASGRWRLYFAYFAIDLLRIDHCNITISLRCRFTCEAKAVIETTNKRHHLLSAQSLIYPRNKSWPISCVIWGMMQRQKAWRSIAEWNREVEANLYLTEITVYSNSIRSMT